MDRAQLAQQQETLRHRMQALAIRHGSEVKESAEYQDLARQFTDLQRQRIALEEQHRAEMRQTPAAAFDPRTFTQRNYQPNTGAPSYIAPNPSQQAKWDRLAAAFVEAPESLLAHKVEQSTARFRSLQRQNAERDLPRAWDEIKDRPNTFRRVEETRTSRDLSRDPVKLAPIVPSLPDQPDWTDAQKTKMAQLKTRMEQILRVSGGADLMTTVLQDKQLNDLLRDKQMPIEVLQHFARIVDRNRQLGVAPSTTIDQMRAAAGQQPTTYLSQDTFDMPTRAGYLFQNRIARRQIAARYQKVATGLGVSVSRLRKALPNLSYEQERYMQEIERNPQGFLHAGPGTGKTEALVWTALNAVASGKIKIHELTMTSQTNAAVEALIDRFSKIAPLFPNWNFERAKQFQFRTTHAMALSDLHRPTVRVENPDEPGTFMRITPMEAMGRGDWKLLGQDKYQQTRAGGGFQGINLEAVAARAENEQLTYFKNMLDRYNVRNLGVSHRSIVQSINETKSHHYDTAIYQERLKRGRALAQRGDLRNADALFYLYEANLHQADGYLGNTGQESPFYDFQDLIHYWNYANRDPRKVGYNIHKRKGFVSDEIQDNTFDMVYGHAANLRPGGFYLAGGDLGQQVVGGNGGRKITDALSRAFPAIFTRMLTGNYRSSREVVAGNNMGNMSEVMQKAGTGPFQVAVGKNAKLGEMPEYVYAPTFAQLHQQAAQDWFAKIGLTMEQLRQNMAEGAYPLKGASLPARAVPIVFQMHDERELFQKALFKELAEQLGSASLARSAIGQFLYDPERTPHFGDTKHANMMHLPMVQQIKGWGVPYVFAMMTREGAWDQAGYERNMNVMRSRAEYGVRYYGAGQNLGSWNQYNNAPGYYQDNPLPHGVKEQLPFFFENLVQNQGMAASEIPGEYQPLLAQMQQQALPALDQTQQAGLGQVIDVLAELQKYAVTPTDATTSGLLTSEQGKLEFGEDENGRLSMPGFTTEFNASGLRARNEQHINVTSLDYAGRTLDLLAQGQAVNGFSPEQLPASVPGLMDALEPTIGRIKEPALDSDFAAPSDLPSDWRKGFENNERTRDIIEDELKQFRHLTGDAGPAQDNDESVFQDAMFKFLISPAVQAQPEIKTLMEEQLTNPKVLAHLEKKAYELMGIKNIYPSMQKRMMDKLTQQFTKAQIGTPLEKLHPIVQALMGRQVLSGKPLSEKTARAQIREYLWPTEKNQRADAKKTRALLREEVRRTSTSDIADMVRGYLDALDNTTEQKVGLSVRGKMVSQIAKGALPDTVIHTLHAVAGRMGERSNHPKTKEIYQTFQKILGSHYGQPIDHTKGLTLSYDDLEAIRRQNPKEAAMLEQLLGPIGENDPPVDVQKAFAKTEQYPYEQGRLESSARSKDFGFSIGQQHIARAVRQMSILAYNMERIGIVDPQARQQVRLYDHNGKEVEGGANVPVGLAVGLESYQKRMQELLAHPGRLSTRPQEAYEQRSYYDQQLQQVTALREALHSPANQQNWGHALNAVMRAAFGKGAFFEKGDSDQHFEAMFSKRNFKGGQPFTLDTLQEYLGALQQTAEHMQRTGSIQRGHVDRVLNALGHDPSDRLFTALHDERMQRHFGEATANLRLTDLAEMFPSSRNASFAELTRAPFQEKTKQYVFMGGAPGFGAIMQGNLGTSITQGTRLGMPVRPQRGLKTGAVGTLHRWDNDRFGLSKNKSVHLAEGLLSEDERKRLNQVQNPDGTINENPAYVPLYFFQEEGKQVMHPVTGNQIADAALLSDAMRQQYRISMPQEGENTFSPSFGVSSESGWMDPAWAKERAARTPEEQAQIKQVLDLVRNQHAIGRNETANLPKALLPTHGLPRSIFDWIKHTGRKATSAYLERIAAGNRAFRPEQRTILAEPPRASFGWKYQGLTQTEKDRLLSSPAAASPPPPPPPPPVSAAPAPEPERPKGPVLSARGFIRDLSAPLPGRVVLPPVGPRPPSRFRRLNGNRMRFDANGQLILATRPERRYAGFLPALSAPAMRSQGMMPLPSPLAPPFMPSMPPLSEQLPGWMIKAPWNTPPVQPEEHSVQPSAPVQALPPEPEALPEPPFEESPFPEFDETMAPPPPLSRAEHLQNLGMAVLAGHPQFNIPAPSDAQRAVIGSDDPNMLLIGGPGSGKTETMVGRLMHMVANTRTLMPNEILPLSAMHSGVNALNQKLQKYRDLLPQGDEYMIPEARSFHSLAHAIITQNAEYDEGTGTTRFPMLEAIGVHMAGWNQVLSNPSEADLALLSPQEREEARNQGISGFLGRTIGGYAQMMGMQAPGSDQIDAYVQHISEMKSRRSDAPDDPYQKHYQLGEAELARNAELRRNQQPIGDLSGDAAMVLYEQQKAWEGKIDFPDQLQHAGEILKRFGEAAIPERFRGIRQVAIDEGQDIPHPALRMLRHFFGALFQRGNNPRLMVGGDYMQNSLSEGLGGIDPNHMEEAYQSLVQDPMRTHTLHENWRSDRGIVALTNSILAHPALQGMKRVFQRSPGSITRAGRAPVVGLARSQPALYDLMLEHMLHTAGLSWERIGQNIQAGRSPMAQRAGMLLPKEIPAVLTRHQDRRLFLAQAHRRIQERLGISASQAYRVRNQMFRTDIPILNSKGSNAAQIEEAKHQFPVVTQAQIRSFDVNAPHLDATNVGGGGIVEYLRRLLIGTSRVSQGGRAHYFATDRPFTKGDLRTYLSNPRLLHDTAAPGDLFGGHVYLGENELKPDPRNMFESFQGSWVPQGLGEIFGRAQQSMLDQGVAPDDPFFTGEASTFVPPTSAPTASPVSPGLAPSILAQMALTQNPQGSGVVPGMAVPPDFGSMPPLLFPKRTLGRRIRWAADDVRDWAGRGARWVGRAIQRIPLNPLMAGMGGFATSDDNDTSSFFSYPLPLQMPALNTADYWQNWINENVEQDKKLLLSKGQTIEEPTNLQKDTLVEGMQNYVKDLVSSFHVQSSAMQGRRELTPRSFLYGKNGPHDKNEAVYRKHHQSLMDTLQGQYDQQPDPKIYDAMDVLDSYGPWGADYFPVGLARKARAHAIGQLNIYPDLFDQLTHPQGQTSQQTLPPAHTPAPIEALPPAHAQVPSLQTSAPPPRVSQNEATQKPPVAVPPDVNAINTINLANSHIQMSGNQMSVAITPGISSVLSSNVVAGAPGPWGQQHIPAPPVTATPPPAPIRSQQSNQQYLQQSQQRQSSGGGSGASGSGGGGGTGSGNSGTGSGGTGGNNKQQQGVMGALFNMLGVRPNFGYGNADIQLGRTLARIGDELQFVGSNMQKQADSSIQQGSEYRHATLQILQKPSNASGLPESAAGSTGTEGYFNFSKAPAAVNPTIGGINTFAQQFSMFSEADIVKTMQQYLASTNQYFDVTKTPQATGDILAVSAMANMDPSQIMQYLTTATGFNQGGQNQDDQIAHLVGMMFKSLKGNLSEQNVAPYLSAIDQMVPLIEGTTSSPMKAPNGQTIDSSTQAAALLQMAIDAGINPANFGTVAAATSTLAQAGYNPDERQQYQFAHFYGEKNLTASPQYFQYQLNQSQQQEQLAGMQLQSNIFGGYTGPYGDTQDNGIFADTLKQFQSMGLSLPGYSTDGQGHSIMHPLSIQDVQIQADNAEIHLAETNFQQSAFQLAQNQATFAFQQNLLNQEYGQIGQDTSRQAYFNFERSQMAAGYNPLNADSATTFKPSTPFGLKNEEFYAGIENQRSMLVLDRSPLLADAKFQQQLKYLNEQENFYQRELQLQNDQRSFDRTWGQRSLDMQAQALGAQKQMLASEILMKEYDKAQAELQKKYLPEQTAFLQMLILNMSQWIQGQGPVNGQSKSPTDIVSSLMNVYSMEGTKGLEKSLRGLGLSADQMKVLERMIQTAASKHETLAQLMNDIANSGDASLLGALGQQSQQGAYANQQQNAGNANANLQGGGTGQAWDNLVAAMQQDTSAAQQLQADIAGGSGLTKHIGDLTSAISPFLGGIAAIANVIGTIAGFAGGAGGAHTGGAGGTGGMVSLPNMHGVGGPPPAPGPAGDWRNLPATFFVNFLEKLTGYIQQKQHNPNYSHLGVLTPHVNADFHARMAYGQHQGVDFEAAQGTPLSEFIGGEVTAAGFHEWGGEVDVLLPGGLTERYLHLSQIGVHPGQFIKRGDRIGLTGGGTVASGLGRWSSGAHSHVQYDYGDINHGGINPWPVFAAFHDFSLLPYYGVSQLQPGSNLRRFADGGIATRPMVGYLGEGGVSEAVIPLTKLGSVLAQTAGTSTTTTTTKTQPAVSVQTLVGTLQLHVHLAQAQMNDQEKDQLMTDVLDVLQTAINQLAGKLSG